jgi:FkbM family methyltransferase
MKEHLNRFQTKARNRGLIAAAIATLLFINRWIGGYIRMVTNIYYDYLVKKGSPMSYHGVTLPTGNALFSREIRSRFARNEYESEEMKALDQHYYGEYDLIDLGASTGFLTAFADNIAGEDITIVAVEANPNLIPLIEFTKEQNQGQFRIENCAYHSAHDTLQFNQHELTVGGSIQRETDDQVSVSAISLGELIDRHDLDAAVVVCDIEGGESDLVLNELTLLEQYCPLLIIEMHNFADDLERVKEVLHSSFQLISQENSTYVFKNPRF